MSAIDTVTYEGRQLRRFIRHPEPIDDGTIRCAFCGQIDEIEVHVEGLCMPDVVAGEYFEDAFTPPRRFIPIDDAARDGDSQLVARRSSFAAAYWAGDMWAYFLPVRPGEKRAPIVEIDFEPTHYSPRTKGD